MADMDSEERNRLVSDAAEGDPGEGFDCEPRFRIGDRVRLRGVPHVFQVTDTWYRHGSKNSLASGWRYAIDCCEAILEGELSREEGEVRDGR